MTEDEMYDIIRGYEESERDYHERNIEIEAENAKLRDELAKWQRLADGIDLPEYPVTQFKPKDLERENAKMREFLSKMHGYYVSGTLKPCDFCDKYCCEGYAQTTCKFDEYDPDGIVVDEVERLMRELGIEAD